MLAAGLDAVGSLTYGVGLTLLGVCYVGDHPGRRPALRVRTRGAGPRRRRDRRSATWCAASAPCRTTPWCGSRRSAGPSGWTPSGPSGGGRCCCWWRSPRRCSVLAAWLTAHRDFGGGLLQARTGRPRASRLLGTPVGLALRLQRGQLIGWAIGLTALGLLYGAVIPTIPDLVASNPDIARAIGVSADAEQALIDAFLALHLLFMAVVSTGSSSSSVLRLHGEEESGRAEAVLATGCHEDRLGRRHRPRRGPRCAACCPW